MSTKKIFTSKDFQKKIASNKKRFKKLLIGAAIFAFVGVAISICINTCGGAMGDLYTSTENPDKQRENLHTTVDSCKLDTIPKDVEKSGTETKLPGSNVLDDNNDEIGADPIPQTITNPIQTNDIETEAVRVIRGDYGNNPMRKAKLGSDYQPIQNRVNQLKREGYFGSSAKVRG